MIRFLVRALLMRSVVAFVVIHIGLVLAVYGLASLSHLKDLDPHLWWILCAGVLCLYGGLLLGIFLLIWPVYSILRKVRKFLQWRDWLLKELPQIIALIPAIVHAFREAFQKGEKPPSATNDKV